MGEIDAVIEMKFFSVSLPSNEAIPFRLLFGGSRGVSFSIMTFHLEEFMCSCSFTVKEGVMAAAIATRKRDKLFIGLVSGSQSKNSKFREITILPD